MNLDKKLSEFESNAKSSFLFKCFKCCKNKSNSSKFDSSSSIMLEPNFLGNGVVPRYPSTTTLNTPLLERLTVINRISAVFEYAQPLNKRRIF